MSRFIPIFALAAFLAGCGVFPGLGGTDSLEARTFLSTAVTVGGADRPLVDGTQIRLSFTDGQIGASAGCNIFGGSYRIADNRLLISGGAMTEMGCDEARSAQDEWLFAFLGSGPTVVLSGNELTLSSTDTVINLLDTEVADPDRPLVGTTWMVTGLIDGDAVSSIPDEVEASLRLTDDGRVEIHSGCNSGGGEYTVSGDTITFSELVSTEMACDGARGEVEAAVFAVLGADSVTYAIDAGGMTLTAGDIGLQLTAE
jgi:heat shock protein HslJ